MFCHRFLLEQQFNTIKYIDIQSFSGSLSFNLYFKFHHVLHILGPLLYKDASTGNAIYRLIGVTSWGFGCGRKDYPGYYAAVYPQLDWIYEIMEKTTKCPNQVNRNELARCSSSVTKDNCTLRSIAILLWLWQLSKQE